MPEITGTPESHVPDALGCPRGLPARLGLEDQPPFPGPIEAIADPALRQRTREVWTTAFRLESILRIWMSFPTLYEMGLSIDSSTQERVSRLFPELNGLGSTLTRLAAGGTGGEGP